ncbi:MAG: thiamine-phosphate pyrophosphorylase [Candidatus Omnitrophica bacterium]|nr:thiamine-phosphate pyrophosphorylase [Candidatus Omnitrophota bacterium]
MDANINRAKEGLRVCEDVCRFVLDNARLTSEFKQIRHAIEATAKRYTRLSCLLGERSALKDSGRLIHTHNELTRRDVRDIFFANIQRAKESVRVLEEFSKLKNFRCALRYKQLRYRVYELEKKAALRLAALCRIR